MGVVIGLLLFALPFLLFKAALLLFFLGALFSLVRRIYGSRRAGGYLNHRYAGYRRYDRVGTEWHPAVADTIRNMSDEEYGTFRQKLAEDRRAATGQYQTIEIQ